MMRFRVEVGLNEIPALVNEFVRIVGSQALARRWQWIGNEIAQNQYMRDWIEQRCRFELALTEVMRRHKEGTLSNLSLTPALYDAIAFVAGVVRIHPRLSTAGQKILHGRLIDGLKSDQGLLSLQHEVGTAIHLRRQGFAVDFNDMEKGGGFDFLAHKGAIKLEVECKMFSGDVGRKIHTRRAKTLFKVLEEPILQEFKAALRGAIVRITIPDRLHGSIEQHAGIKETVARALLDRVSVTISEHCSIKVYDFDLAESPFARLPAPQADAVADFVKSITAQEQVHVVSHFSPSRRAIVVTLESEKPDAMLKGFDRVLRDSALKQFTREHPGVLAVQLEDLTEDQLHELARLNTTSREHATGLQRMTSDFLQSASRAHVHSVVYRAHGTLTRLGDATTSASLAYFVANQNHPRWQDPEYLIFREKFGTPITATGDA